MSLVPPPSPRVLAELRPELERAAAAAGRTAVTRALTRLEAVLGAHAAALAALDRLEEAVVAAHG